MENAHLEGCDLYDAWMEWTRNSPHNSFAQYLQTKSWKMNNVKWLNNLNTKQMYQQIPRSLAIIHNLVPNSSHNCQPNLTQLWNFFPLDKSINMSSSKGEKKWKKWSAQSQKDVNYKWVKKVNIWKISIKRRKIN